MLSVTIPLQAQNLPVDHRRLMTEFQIDNHVCRGTKGQESRLGNRGRKEGWRQPSSRGVATQYIWR